MKISYNSSRPDLLIREYGRSIHNMVNHAVSIEDREERNRCARAIISTMGNLFPYLRDVDDFKHKLWDHLHVMAEFKLDVDSPYEVPSKEELQSKPSKVAYPTGKIKYGHYGKTVEAIIEKVLEEKDLEKRVQLAIGVGNLMKRTYVVWNQGSVKDSVIANDLRKLSNGELIIENPEDKLQSTKEVIQQMGVDQSNKNQNRSHSKKRQHGRKGGGGGGGQRKKRY